MRHRGALDASPSPNTLRHNEVRVFAGGIPAWELLECGQFPGTRQQLSQFNRGSTLKAWVR